MSDNLPESDRVPGVPHPRETQRLFGQQAAERAFLDAWSGGRLHHAWLLRGPQGVGKATLAYRIARALIAHPVAPPGGGLFGEAEAAPVPETLDAPPDCPVAARIRAGAEPRLVVLRRALNTQTGKLRTQIRVDEVRGVKSFLGLSAADGGWRAVIVDAADEMNTAAANALLKVLEEPPARTVMLLVSHAPGRLLPTIRSRCRALDLATLAPGDLGAALAQAGAETGGADREVLAELSGGSVGAALRLTAEGGLDLYAALLGAFGDGRGVERGRMIQLAERLSGRGAEAQAALAHDLLVLLLGRLARHGAGRPPAVAAPGEAALMEAVARNHAQAMLWAEAAGRIASATHHARAVNLDPAQTIMDTFLDLDDTLARALRAA